MGIPINRVNTQTQTKDNKNVFSLKQTKQKMWLPWSLTRTGVFPPSMILAMFTFTRSLDTSRYVWIPILSPSAEYNQSG